MNNVSFLKFSGKVIVSHFLTYFLTGLIFYLIGLNVVVYYETHPTIPLATELFRSTQSLLVTAGPLFQLLRGALFCLALYPFRKVFLEDRKGWLYLWGIFLVFAILAPSSAAPGSIEGLIYTNFPLEFHLMYLPEILIQTLAFSGLLIFWVNHPVKKLTIPLVVLFCLILLMIVPGVLMGLG